MSDNNAMIIVHPTAVEVVPKDRKVLAGIQPFKLGIDWSDNQNTWEVVTVSDFVRVGDNSKVEIEGPAEFRKDENFVKEIRFKSIERKTDFCNYQLVCWSARKQPALTFHLLLLAPGGQSAAGLSKEGEEQTWMKITRS